MSHETFNAPPLEQLAEMLPAYEFEAFIAQGGMGAVYKARQRSLDREVAIKILPRELGADPKFRKSFETEAKAMAKLNHPNLVSVYDYGDIDGMPYIVMEYVDGKSLYHSAWNTIVEPEQAIDIVKGICLGLANAHEQGILHRDIKPANILLTPKAEPKIGDFGLAQATDFAGSGEVMGTPGYAAPELTYNPEQVGIATDIYAVGVILNELITGTTPDPTGQTPLRAHGDRRLDAIWKKATDPVVANRYPSAEAMAQDLATWKPTTQRLNTGTGTGASPRRLVVASSEAATAPIPKLKSARKGPGAGTIVALLLITGAAFVYMNYFKTEEKPFVEVDGTTNADSSIADVVATTDEIPESPPQESSVTAPPIVARNETVEQSIERLKSDLAAGNFEELPLGTKRRGRNYYLVWETPMNWYQAQAFAEEHGAHLMTLQSNEDLTWISETVPGDQTTWIGAGRLGPDVWANIDGKKWAVSNTPKGVGLFATLNGHGILRAGKISDSLPFVLQWHEDGSNPATLESILKRTKDTLSTPNPTYPPGTDSSGARRITIIPIPVTRSEAIKFAEMAGGVLAVPASTSDADWIAERTENLESSGGIWLGGRRKDGVWTWDTGEVWDKTSWAGDADPESGGDALIHVPGKGWSTADPFKPAAGFAIEWSKDASK